MPVRFIDVVVESHSDLPSGCSVRFKAHGPTHDVHRVRFEPDDGPDGIWTTWACDGDGLGPAHAAVVDDSSAGLSTLVWGGTHGLRLRLEGGTEEVAEPYLLLAAGEIVD